MKKLIAVLALTMSVNTAYAKTHDFNYKNGTENAELIFNDDTNKAELSLGTSGCAGSVSGDLTIVEKGKQVLVISDDKECVVSFKHVGNKLYGMQESSGCLNYHGAACSFSMSGVWDQTK